MKMREEEKAWASEGQQVWGQQVWGQCGSGASGSGASGASLGLGQRGQVQVPPYLCGCSASPQGPGPGP